MPNPFSLFLLSLTNAEGLVQRQLEAANVLYVKHQALAEDHEVQALHHTQLSCMYRDRANRLLDLINERASDLT